MNCNDNNCKRTAGSNPTTQGRRTSVSGTHNFFAKRLAGHVKRCSAVSRGGGGGEEGLSRRLEQKVLGMGGGGCSVGD